MQAMSAWALLLIALTCFARGSWADQCDKSSILIEIHDRQIHGRANLLRYGLAVGLGTPSQNDSLWPAIAHNETAFSTSDYCDSNHSQSCLENARGFFVAQDSSTWQNSSKFHALDSPPSDSRATRLNGQDTLNIWQTTDYSVPQKLITVEQFPTMLLSNLTTSADATSFFGPGGLLGLGPSSTFLSRLVQGGLITARSFALYLGPSWSNAEDDRKGALVLGGYDSARFRAPLATFEQVPALSQNLFSPFMITVDQISLMPSDGQTVIDLVDDSFNAYISTDQRPLRFPPRVTDKLVQALQAEAAGNKENTLRLSTGFEGKLIIRLSNNINLTFDSSWLADSSRTTPISAAPLQLNALAIDTIPDNSDFPAIFGAAFLSQLYMFVNYDANPPNFALSQALSDVDNTQQNPFCVQEELGSPHTVAAKSAKSSKKALIGGICGGLLGGILVAALLLSLRRRRRKHVKYPAYSSFSNGKSCQCQRPTLLRIFQRWKSQAWKAASLHGFGKKTIYAYKDIDSRVNQKPHVSAFMYTAGDVEKDCTQPQLAKRGSKWHKHVPSSASLEHMDRAPEANLTQTSSDSRQMPPLKGPGSGRFEVVSTEPVYSHKPSTTVLLQGQTPLSTYNRQSQSQSLLPRQARDSRTNEGGMSLDAYRPFLSQKPKEAAVTVLERAIYDKSLPATPAASTPQCPSPIARCPSFHMPSSEVAVLDGLQRPVIAFEPAHLSVQQMSDIVPPVPAMPPGYLSTATAWTMEDRYDSTVLPAHDHNNSVDQKVKVFNNLTFSPSSTRSIFWRRKGYRSGATTTSVADSVDTKRRSAASSKYAATSTKDGVTAQRQYSQKPQLRQRTSTRARIAMAARISRLKELQQTGVREIVIRKKGKGKTPAQSEIGMHVAAVNGAQSVTATMKTASTTESLTAPNKVTKRDPSTLSKSPQTRIATVPADISPWTNTADLGVDVDRNRADDVHRDPSFRYSTVSSSSSVDGHRPLSPVSAFSEGYEQGTANGEQYRHSGHNRKHSTKTIATTMVRESLPPLPPVPAAYAHGYGYSSYVQFHGRGPSPGHGHDAKTDNNSGIITNTNANINDDILQGRSSRSGAYNVI